LKISRLTLNGSKSDAEKLVLQFTIGEIGRVPHTRLLVPGVFLHRHRRNNCKNTQAHPLHQIQENPNPNHNQKKKKKKNSNKQNIKQLTEMIGADLEGLGLPHNKANLFGLLVLEELHRTSAPLFPLVPIFIESV
jgi:hypothetical protein